MKTTTKLAAAFACTAVAAGGLALSPASASAPAQRPVWVKALTTDGRLVAFASDAPGRAYAVGTIRGLVGDDQLVGMDYRPADGKLYAVGDAGGLYVVGPRTGIVTPAGRLTVPLVGTRFGVDFNPAADRLRIVSDTGQNLRHDPNPGGTTTEDTPLNTPPSTATTTGVDAAAYVNNDNSTDTGTLLFDINSATDQVVAQVPANSGTLSTVGLLGVSSDGPTGFDVFSTLAGGRAVANQGYATLAVAGGSPAFYTVDVTSGKATLVGSFPTRIVVADIAVQLNR